MTNRGKTFDRIFLGCRMSRCNGGVAERLKATVLKTVDGQLSVSSNLTSSAISNTKPLIFRGFFMPVFFGIQIGIPNEKRAYCIYFLHRLGLGAGACRRQNRHRFKSDYIFLCDLHRLHLVSVHPPMQGGYLATKLVFIAAWLLISLATLKRKDTLS